MTSGISRMKGRPRMPGCVYGVSSPPSAGHDHIDFPASAFGTAEPLGPTVNRHFGEFPYKFDQT
jgi:hypothetical protein